MTIMVMAVALLVMMTMAKVMRRITILIVMTTRSVFSPARRLTRLSCSSLLPMQTAAADHGVVLQQALLDICTGVLRS